MCQRRGLREKVGFIVVSGWNPDLGLGLCRSVDRLVARGLVTPISCVRQPVGGPGRKRLHSEIHTGPLNKVQGLRVGIWSSFRLRAGGSSRAYGLCGAYLC